jgi:hypothetical protein
MPKIMDEGTIKTLISNCRLYWCFCLGWCSNFVDSESGQKQSVKLLQNLCSTTQVNTPLTSPHSHTLSVYTVQCIYLGKEGRGGGGQREGRWATVKTTFRVLCLHRSFVRAKNEGNKNLSRPSYWKVGKDCKRRKKEIDFFRHNVFFHVCYLKIRLCSWPLCLTLICYLSRCASPL